MNDSAPIHPGEHLAEILAELGISQYRLAKANRRGATTHQRDRPRPAFDHGRYRAADRSGSGDDTRVLAEPAEVVRPRSGPCIR